MIELILTEAGTAGRPGTSMSLDTFKGIVDILLRERFLEVILRFDQSSPPSELPTIMAMLKSSGLQTSFFISNEYEVDSSLFDLFKENNAQIILSSINNDKDKILMEQSPAHSRLYREYPKKCVFLPVSSPRLDAQALVDSVQSLPSASSILLGVGWDNYYTGPALPDDADSELWANLVTDLLTRFFNQQKSVAFLCGLPLCFFQTEKLGKLVRLQKSWPISYCNPELSIDTQGKVALCSKAGFNHERNMVQEGSLKKIAEHLMGGITQIRDFCDLSADLSCPRIRSRSCGGVCVRYSLGSWKKFKN